MVRQLGGHLRDVRTGTDSLPASLFPVGWVGPVPGRTFGSGRSRGSGGDTQYPPPFRCGVSHIRARCCVGGLAVVRSASLPVASGIRRTPPEPLRPNGGRQQPGFCLYAARHRHPVQRCGGRDQPGAGAGHRHRGGPRRGWPTLPGPARAAGLGGTCWSLPTPCPPAATTTTTNYGHRDPGQPLPRGRDGGAVRSAQDHHRPGRSGPGSHLRHLGAGRGRIRIGSGGGDARDMGAHPVRRPRPGGRQHRPRRAGPPPRTGR